MLIAAVVVVVMLLAPVAYVVYRKFSVVRQQIEFTAPQDGVAAIHLDIHEDTVRSLRIVFADGTSANCATWTPPERSRRPRALRVPLPEVTSRTRLGPRVDARCIMG